MVATTPVKAGHYHTAARSRENHTATGAVILGAHHDHRAQHSPGGRTDASETTAAGGAGGLITPSSNAGSVATNVGGGNHRLRRNREGSEQNLGGVVWNHLGIFLIYFSLRSR
jgi:hypothetical protein